MLQESRIDELVALSLQRPRITHLNAEYVARVVPTRNSLSHSSMSAILHNGIRSVISAVEVASTYDRSRTSERIDSPKKMSSGFN